MLSTVLSAAVISLALQTAAPPAAQTDGPVSTAPRPLNMYTAPLLNPVRLNPDDLPLPKDAPADDFGLVSWCHGALTGHLDLYHLVKPALSEAGYVQDEAMIEAGRYYLKLYSNVIDAALAVRKDPEMSERSLQLREQGYGIWAAAASADVELRKDTFLGWQLPGRCEHAARRLQDQLLTANPTIAEAKP
jgi:hypothetical protein